jgi:hypothetical protein
VLNALTIAALQVDRVYSAPSSDNTAGYIELFQRNTHIIYPMLAVLVLVMMIAAILQAWRTHDMDLSEKMGHKKEIVMMLRQQLGGVSADAISRSIGLENLKTQKLLEDMQRDGILISHTNTSRLTLWRLKGIGPQRSV